VTLTFLSTPVAAGAQALIRAVSAPGARCILEVNSPDGEEIITRTTFVDGTGRVFWLWSVPLDAPVGAWPVEITCGGDPIETALLIQNVTTTSIVP
jgi:hypothetical protein